MAPLPSVKLSRSMTLKNNIELSLHNRYLELHSANSLKQQSADRHVVPLGHIILIPNNTSVFALSLLCCVLALWRSIASLQSTQQKYQFYSLWFDPIGARTYELPHSTLYSPPYDRQKFEISVYLLISLFINVFYKSFRRQCCQ
jgi:hypothetical protein